MKVLLLLLPIALLSLAQPLSAADPAAPVPKKKPRPEAAPAPAPPAADPNAPRAIGMYVKVDAVDPQTRTFTHTHKDGTVVKYQVTDKTELRDGSKPATFDQIAAGLTVSGSRLRKSATEYEVVKITRIDDTKKKPEAARADAKKKP